MSEWERMEREQQKTDVIYVTPSGGVFVSPDGIGRIWYDSEEEAAEQHGDHLETVYLDVEPWD